MSDTTQYHSDAQATPRAPRAPAREVPPRTAAAPTAGVRLQRRRRVIDSLYVDPRIIPASMSYEWKLESVFGQPWTAHTIAMRENHWKPVPASRHPELAIAGDATIRRDGSILCERPKYLTEEAQMEDLQAALRPVEKLEAIMFGDRPNEFTRNHPSVRKVSGVRQQWAPGPPVDESGGGMAGEP